MISLKHFSALVVVCFGLSSFCYAQESKVNYRVIPLPQNIETQQGNPFVLNSRTIITYPKSKASLKHEAGFLASYLKETTGKSIKVVMASTKTQKTNVIALSLD